MSATTEGKSIITFDDSKCIGCNACVRACPVNAVSMKLRTGSTDQFISSVIPDRCIQCGECIKACTRQARGYSDDSKMFFENFTEKHLHIMVSPSIKVAFKNWKSILKWLQMLGHKIYDVSYGADICTWAHLQAINSGEQSKIISQQCPAIVNFIEKYQPSLIDSLSEIHSPAGCLAIYLKKYQKIEDDIYLLSPCIAKTAEARRNNTFTYNVTFYNLAKYISENDVDLPSEPFEFDLTEGCLGKLYPRPGGLKDNLLAFKSELVIRTSHGNDVYKRLDNISSVDKEKRPDVLDCLHCQYGCNGGTASTDFDSEDIEAVMDQIEIDANANRGKFIFKDKIYKELSKKVSWKNFVTEYSLSCPESTELTEDEYEKQFRVLLKFTDTSRNINCGSCGYSTCREMCKAIHNGYNVKENCIYYMKEQRELDIAEKNILHEKMNKESSFITKIAVDLINLLNSYDTILNSSTSPSVQSIEYIKTLRRILSGFEENVKENGITQNDASELTKMLGQVLQILESVQNSLSENIDKESSISVLWKEIRSLTNDLKSSQQNIDGELSETPGKIKSPVIVKAGEHVAAH